MVLPHLREPAIANRLLSVIRDARFAKHYERRVLISSIKITDHEKNHFYSTYYSAMQ